MRTHSQAKYSQAKNGVHVLSISNQASEILSNLLVNILLIKSRTEKTLAPNMMSCSVYTGKNNAYALTYSNFLINPSAKSPQV